MDPRDPGDGHLGARGEEDADGDAVEHLWNAAHEMLRAMRSLLDAADEFVESQRGRPGARDPDGHEPREGRVHHIDIDGRSESRGAAGVDADAS